MAVELTITAQMLKDLRTLHRAKPMGCALGKGAWRSPAGTIADENAAMLLVPGLARKDYSRRSPRLLITAAGKRRLSELSPRSL